MNPRALIVSLRQIRTLVADCLREMGDDDGLRTRAKRDAPAAKRATRNALPDHILELRDKNFFKEPRTGREVHEKLRSTYPCEVDRVVMALLRLNERKKLRRASKLVDKKRQVAYVW